MASSSPPRRDVHQVSREQVQQRGRRLQPRVRRTSEDVQPALQHLEGLNMSDEKAEPVESSPSGHARSSRSADDRKGTAQSTATQVDRQGSICQSPTWSPRGSQAARRQTEKERREQQRQQRKEAEEARRRLKEEEQRRKAAKGSNNMESSSTTSTKRPGRRLTKQPPPAAMETQRMPAALRAEQPQAPIDEPARQRRSSSLSSVIRFVTGSRSRSRSRREENANDEAYMSDGSVKSKSSFIGGIKLKYAASTGGRGPLITDSALQLDSVDFGDQLRARMDGITGQESRNSSAASKTRSLAASLSRSQQPERQNNAVQAQSGDTSKPDESGVGDGTSVSANSSPRVSRMSSVRLASMNRMQNLVTPLRSAMKGGRETAAAGKAQSMPVFTTGSQKPPARPGGDNYVQRSRMSAQSRSLAGWRDEMAVKKANEDNTALTAFGPQMPPTPDQSIDNLPRPSKESQDRSGGGSLHTSVNDSQKTLTPIVIPGTAEQIVWKQPIKANKAAAALRVDEFRELNSKKNEIPSDIDSLPSQKTLKTSASKALKPAASVSSVSKLRSNGEAGLGSELLHEDKSSPTESVDSGLRRKPAVMSWKVEKDKNGKVYPSSPRSATSPTFSPVSSSKEFVPPEQHPSLMALRGHMSAVQPASEVAPGTIVSAMITDEDLHGSIDRPFSIAPTPKASPIPGDLITMTKTQQSRIPTPVRRHSTPVEAIEEARTGSKAQNLATNTSKYPFPNRHKTLKKPEKRDPDRAESSRRESDKENNSSNEDKTGAGKVTFHTPPESPYHLAVSTSYDAYRRPYSNTKIVPALAPLEAEDQIELPVPVGQLSKPNPPFAQSAQASRARRSRDSSPKGNSQPEGDGFVYLPFSPSASSSSLNVSGKPHGFKFKNPDGTKSLDWAVKVFVICCKCRKWHDIPSVLYKEMSQGPREIDPKKDRIAEVRPPTHGESNSSQDNRRKDMKKSKIVTTVPCCWCNHEMSTSCCEGWSTICYKRSQHHALNRRDENAASAAASPRIRAAR